MKESVEFKAYGADGKMMGHTWATKGSIAERSEREMYQRLLNKGHYFRVEVITEVLTQEPDIFYRGFR